jgi:hypothetical protein
MQQQSGDDFRFPKHGELFNEDYYDEPETKKGNPYSDDPSGVDDGQNWDRPSFRSTQTGILANYKK